MKTLHNLRPTGYINSLWDKLVPWHQKTSAIRLPEVVYSCFGISLSIFRPIVVNPSAPWFASLKHGLTFIWENLLNNSLHSKAMTLYKFAGWTLVELIKLTPQDESDSIHKFLYPSGLALKHDWYLSICRLILQVEHYVLQYFEENPPPNNLSNLLKYPQQLSSLDFPWPICV